MVTVDLDKLTPAGRRILETAASLFYRQGIHAVGVDAIAAQAEVTKKTIYACFGSKDQLVTAYLVERDQQWREFLTRLVDERGGSPRDRVLGTFTALACWMDRDDFRGCGFVNALAEIPSADHPAHEVIIQQKKWMLGYFARLAEAAGAEDPEGVSKSLFLLYEGVTVAAATGFPEAAEHASKTAAALV